MPTISIRVDKDILKELERRARKEYLSVRELIEDIVRRSCVVSKSRRRAKYKGPKVDKFIQYFSRYKPYLRRKKKGKK